MSKHSKEDVHIANEEITVQSADTGLTLIWPANRMFEADPYGAFVSAFENAYHGARSSDNMNEKEYSIIMRLADVLVEEDPAVDTMLDRSSL